ncbi:hypothetical protein ACFU93_32595 [Streptomyces sp. NPDC057611]|uniref:hypothetical protein n=1 Tax=Streptomyces sp. NPDC057611 TaxID=3346182 RepID=UPI0036C9D14C
MATGRRGSAILSYLQVKPLANLPLASLLAVEEPSGDATTFGCVRRARIALPAELADDVQLGRERRLVEDVLVRVAEVGDAWALPLQEEDAELVVPRCGLVMNSMA